MSVACERSMGAEHGMGAEHVNGAGRKSSERDGSCEQGPVA